MATDYLGMLGQAGNAWYSEKKFGDAEDSISKGFDNAEQSVIETQQPYQEFGLGQMGNYSNMEDFKFGPEEFAANQDAGYEFRQAEGAKQVSRSNAANKMLQSGNTLAGLQQRGQDIASDEFQAAFGRAKDTYGMNLDKNKFGTELGAKVAMNMGDNLADIGIGRGLSLAQLDSMQAQRMSEIIGSTLKAAGQASDPNTISGMVNAAIDKGVGTVGDWLTGQAKDLAFGKAKEYGLAAMGGGTAAAGMGTAAFGTAATTGAGALGTAAGTNGIGAMGFGEAGTAWGADIGAGALGGAEAGAAGGLSGSGATAVAGSFGSWAGSVVPALGIMFALKTGVEMLRGPDAWSKVMSGMPKDGDPLKYIAGLNEDKLPRQGSGAIGQTALNASQSRGSLYGAILNNMTDEQMQGLRYHNNIGAIVNDMWAFAKSGVDSGGKHSPGGDPTAVLERLFPEIAGNITLEQRKRADEESSAYHDNAMIGDESVAWSFMQDMQDKAKQSQYSQWSKNGQGFVEGVNVQQYINQKLRYWSGQKTAGEIAQEYS